MNSTLVEKKDLINYCHIAFMNGVSDAISVLILHKVFAILMTGNIIFFITDLAHKLEFSDFVRLSLLVSFIVSNVIFTDLVSKRSLRFRIAIALIFVLIYFSIGNFAYNSNNLQNNNWWFFIVANIATIMGVFNNNIFYSFSGTKFNLVVYTLNLLNLARMISSKNYKEGKSLGSTFLSFILGLLVATFSVYYFKFYTVLFMIPVLLNLYRLNRKSAS